MRFAKQLLTLGLALGSAGLVSCSIPKPECTVGQTTTIPVGQSGVMAFSVRYVLQSGTGECAELKGDVIGMQSYHPATADDPQIRDFAKTSIAIRTQSHGELVWMNEDFGIVNEGDNPNAIGDFTAAEPDASDLCVVPSAEARVVFPGAPVDLGIPCTTGGTECGDNGFPTATCEEVDPMDPTILSCVYTFAAADLGYKWSNIQFYVTAAATGTQFTADLEVTLNGCTATYKAIGMWPAVDCTDYNLGTPDDRLCHPEPDPKNAELPRPYGSGINPDFGPVVCDASIAVVPVVDDYYSLFAGAPLSVPRCVLQNDTIPQLEGFPELVPAE
ncbi:MAG: hypothetical protein IPK82_01840 [Polyangiaceae bacterium]|nr:hypothetical protein [Polyangiaceae bacterium]